MNQPQGLRILLTSDIQNDRFTRSKIFEIYYFRIWLALVIFAALHALVFLPVLLSLVGGSEGYIDPESDGSLEEDLNARRYRALLPQDDYDSDDF